MAKDSSALQRTNKVVLLINFILDLFLVLGYTGEVIKKQKSVEYVIVFALLVLIPMGIAFYFYRKNKDSEKIKYITLAGYFIVYIFAMFTASNLRLLVYVYMFPIILMYFLYFDLALMVTACSSALVINIAKIVYSMMQGKNNPDLTTDYTIQFASVFLYGVSLIVATKLSNKFNTEKMENIQEQKKQQEAILEDVLKIAAVMDKNSKEVYAIVGELAAATGAVSNAVHEIAKGSAETADNMQIQSQLSSEIQEIIVDTSKASEDMGEISQATEEFVKKGMEIVESLNHKATVVNESSENVYNTMLQLKDNSNEIQNITSLITGISEQTNLLSLNAAIESARAGEAGKGFAVVAEEIRKLAIQSKDSANNIKNIINELHEKSDQAVEAVVKLKQVNDEQNDLIDNTQKIFVSVTEKIKEVNDNINLVSRRVNEIVGANDKLVESIQHISSASQQATASTQEADAMTNQSIQKANNAQKLVQELIYTSKQMEKHIK